MPAMKRLTRLGLTALLLAMAASALWPVADRVLAQRRVRRQLHALEGVAARQEAGPSVRSPVDGPRPLLPVREEIPLASWGNIGGCGAGGGSASSPGGGIKWVGRNVTGGLVDVQCLPSETLAHGNSFSTFSTRLGGSPAQRWGLAVYVPTLYKRGDVTVLGQTKSAGIAGFGDVSLEVSRKLGVSGQHYLALIGSTPTGAHDAVRQGIVLPQHLQLGSGVPGITGQYQYTRDRDWGLMLLGGTVSYAGWENSIGDYRAPSATASAHVGYLLGRFVPSTGLTLFGKPAHDRERGAARPASNDPLVMLIPGVGLEWSSDWVAFFMGATLGLSQHGLESTTLGLGVSSSLF
jgi:hypothetical protein